MKDSYKLRFIKRHDRVSATVSICARRTVYLYASRRVASTWDYQISI